MALHLPTFFKRTGSAIVFAIVMMAGFLWTEWAFLILICVIQAMCLREYVRLMQKIEPDNYWPSWLHPAMQVTGFLFVLFSFYLPEGRPLTPAFLALPILLVLCTTLNQKKTLNTALHAIGGLIYITLPMVLLMELRLQSLLLPLGLILMIWTNDTMAYLVGSFIGKTPFSPISPKKTWEGTAGGALLTIAGAGLFGYFSDHYRMIDWMALALCAAVAGTAGDLFESRIKRLADVKDSGTMMPGHGGALDRFDSLLVATPFAFAYAYIFLPPLPIVIF